MSLSILLIEDKSFFAGQLFDDATLNKFCRLDIVGVNASYKKVQQKLAEQFYDWVIFSENYSESEEIVLAKELLNVQANLKIGIVKGNVIHPKKVDERIHFIISSNESTEKLAQKIINITQGEKSGDPLDFSGTIMPAPKYFSGASKLSKLFLKDLWTKMNDQRNLFLIYPKGSEIQLISKELSSWMGSLDGFDYINFNYITSPSLRAMINDAEGSGGKRNIISIRNLHNAIARQKFSVLERISNEDNYTGDLRLVFWIESRLVKNGSDIFSPELFNIIKERALVVPKLSDRLADIADYAMKTYSILSQGKQSSAPVWTPEAIGLLLQYSWPENYAELVHFISYLTREVHAKSVTEKILKGYFQTNGKGEDLPHNTGYKLESVVERRRNALLEEKIGQDFMGLSEYLSHAEL